MYARPQSSEPPELGDELVRLLVDVERADPYYCESLSPESSNPSRRRPQRKSWRGSSYPSVVVNFKGITTLLLISGFITAYAMRL